MGLSSLEGCNEGIGEGGLKGPEEGEGVVGREEEEERGGPTF